MKKLTLALSFACAGALAFADSEQWQTSWFNGIGSGVTAISDMKATNGTWDPTTLTADCAEISDGALVLDLDDDLEAKFTVTDAATDEKTAQKISVTGVFTPIASTDLPSSTDMGSDGKNAQLGFAVVSTTDDSSTTYTYQAWVGNNWVSLGTCADKDAQTALTVTFAYWDASVTATFTISNNGSAVDLGNNATLSLSGSALTVAKNNAKVSSVACTGSGTLSALTGDAQYAVATVGDRNYGTVADAITAASGSTVTLVRNPDGEVEIADGTTAKIDENGKTATIKNNGTLEIPLTTTQVDAGNTSFTISVTGTKPTVTTTDTTKECSVSDIKDGKATVTVQTKTSILDGVKFNEVNLMKNETAFRKFMTDNKITAYTGKGASTEAETTSAIQSALAAEGDNKLTLWQSYALGISPTTTLAPTYAESDSGTDAIKIALKPSVNTESITPSGDFTIKYRVTDGTTTKEVSGTPSAIEVPMDKTGRYSVNVVFSAPSTSTSTGGEN